jgi:hypothetical protein
VLSVTPPKLLNVILSTSAAKASTAVYAPEAVLYAVAISYVNLAASATSDSI